MMKLPFLQSPWLSVTRCLSLSLLCLSVSAISEGKRQEEVAGPQIGLQTWTCRDLNFEEMVSFAVAHDIRYLQLALVHLSPEESLKEILRKKRVLAENGLIPYSFGVNRTPGGEEANRLLFEFARLMGMTLIVVEPENPSEWDELEELAIEYDMRLAIHNHGTGTAYESPETVKAILSQRDKRVGVCLDVGWVTEAGFDAGVVFSEYGDRVFDIHIKDKDAEVAKVDKGISHRLIGEGDVDFDLLCSELLGTSWSGVLALEIDFRSFGGDVADAVDQASMYLKEHLVEIRR